MKTIIFLLMLNYNIYIYIANFSVFLCVCYVICDGLVFVLYGVMPCRLSWTGFSERRVSVTHLFFGSINK